MVTRRDVAVVMTLASLGWVAGCGPGVATSRRAPDSDSFPSHAQALLDAEVLARQSILRAGPRELPELITWPTRVEIGKCDSFESRNTIAKAGLKFNSPLHYAIGAGTAALLGLNITPANSEAFGRGFGFHYHPSVAKRFCSPVDQSQPESPTFVDGMTRVYEWWSMTHTPSMQPSFSTGDRVAGVGWQLVRRNMARDGDLVSLSIRSEDGHSKQKHDIKVTIPDCLMEHQPCPVSSGSIASGVATLDQFYWIELGPGDSYEYGQEGDFILLREFHLIEKKGDRWLWSTFWWDPGSKAFRPPKLGLAVDGAAGAQRVWDNYAMDATYNPTEEVFNPNREFAGSNCAFCHARAGISPLLEENLPHQERAKENSIPIPFRNALWIDFLFGGERLVRPQ